MKKENFQKYNDRILNVRYTFAMYKTEMKFLFPRAPLNISFNFEIKQNNSVVMFLSQGALTLSLQ